MKRWTQPHCRSLTSKSLSISPGPQTYQRAKRQTGKRHRDGGTGEGRELGRDMRGGGELLPQRPARGSMERCKLPPQGPWGDVEKLLAGRQWEANECNGKCIQKRKKREGREEERYEWGGGRWSERSERGREIISLTVSSVCLRLCPTH